jgi:CheY-like chemotaxis protein
MKSVLVVDDEFDLANTLRAILEGEGYHVETSADGRDALERLNATPPDLVLMDVMMPLLSGLEVLQVMRRTPGLNGVPVILMSVITPSVKRSDYEWQAFLKKPFTLQSLVKTVHQLIGEPSAAAK